MKSLEDTEVGDVLAYYDSYRSAPEKIIVTRTLQTRVLCGQRAFIRKTCRLVGGGAYRSPWAEPWTAEHDQRLIDIRAERRLSSSRGKLRDFRWHTVTQEQANAVLAAMAATGIALTEAA